jgi:hypothetical protein
VGQEPLAHQGQVDGQDVDRGCHWLRLF